MAEQSFWDKFTSGAGSLLNTWGSYEDKKNSIELSRISADTERAKAKTALAAASRPSAGVASYQGPSESTAPKAGSQTFLPQLSGSGLGMGTIVLLGAMFVLSKVL